MQGLPLFIVATLIVHKLCLPLSSDIAIGLKTLAALILSSLDPPFSFCSHYSRLWLRRVNFTNSAFYFYFNMFAKPRYPLAGPAFHEAYKDVGAKAALAFESLTRYAVIMSPKKWLDTLTSHQSELFHYITDKTQLTSRIVEQVEEDLAQVPCLAVAYTGEYEDRFLVLSTFAGRVLCLSLKIFALNAGGIDEDSYADVLPPRVNQWLGDPGTYKVSTLTPQHIHNRPGGLIIRGLVETSSVFLHFQDCGIIVPKVKAINPMEDWQLSFAASYHHHPASREDLRELLGPLNFKHGRRPLSRQARWAPRSAPGLSAATAFFLYFEAASQQLFISRLLRHALVYGGVPCVRRFDNLRDLYDKFLDRCKRITADYYVFEDGQPPDDGDDEDPRPDDHPLAALERDRRLQEGQGQGQGRLRPPSPPREPDAAPPPVKSEAESRSSEVEMILIDDELNWDDDSETTSHYIQARTPVQPDTCSHEPTADADRRTTFSNEDSHSSITADFFSARSVVLHSPKRALDRGEAVATETGARRKEKRQRILPPSDTDVLAPHVALQGSRPGSPLADPSVPSPFAPKRTEPSSTATSGAWERSLLESSPVPTRLTSTRPSVSWSTKLTMPAKQRPMDSYSRLPKRPPPLKQESVLSDNPVVTYHKQDLRATINLARQARALKAEPQDWGAPRPRPLDLCMSHAASRAAKHNAHRESVRKTRTGAYQGRRRRHTQAEPFNRHARLVDKLTPEELEQHAFVDKPRFHLLCQFCTGSHCSRVTSDTGLVNCRLKEYHDRATATREICPYLRCHDKQTHMIDACPALHGRCPRCACRGHGLEDNCDVTNSDIMEALLSDFEMFANDGFYTYRRIKGKEPERAAWGFFPMDRKSALTFSYKHLLTFPVLEALAMVRSVGALQPALNKNQ